MAELIEFVCCAELYGQMFMFHIASKVRDEMFAEDGALSSLATSKFWQQKAVRSYPSQCSGRSSRDNAFFFKTTALGNQLCVSRYVVVGELLLCFYNIILHQACQNCNYTCHLHALVVTGVGAFLSC